MSDTEKSLVLTVNLPSRDPALEKQDTSHLTLAQRESMMARAAILDRIDICSESFNKGAVIKQLIERCENAEPGSPLYELVKSANFKSGKGHPKLSRPTIFAWYKLRQKKGIIGLAPKPSRVPNMSVPPWVPASGAASSGAATSFADEDQNDISSLAQQLEDVTEPIFAETLDQIQAILNTSANIEHAQQRLLEFAAAHDIGPMGNLIAGAMAVANLQGREEAGQPARADRED